LYEVLTMSAPSRIAGVLHKAVLLLLAVIVLGGAGWGVWHWQAGGNHASSFRTEKVTRGRVAALINASGTVVPEEVVDVGAQVAGKIVEFGPEMDKRGKPIPGKVVDYRSQVKKGALLAVIDKALYSPDVDVARADVASAAADLEVARADVLKNKADLEALRAKLDQAVSDLDRGRRMRDRSIAQQELDALKQVFLSAKAGVPAGEAAVVKAEKTVLKCLATLERAKAALERAQTNLRYCDIVSPVDGVVVDRRVNIGQTVVSSLNAPSLFLIAKDLKKMQVWVSVNEADVGQIHEGDVAHFKVDAFPKEVFPGQVSQIRLNASMTQNVVTYTVVVDTNNDNLKLLPYLTANLQFRVGERHDVLLVPNSALRYRPAIDRVHPDDRDAYAALRNRKVTVTELKPGKIQKTHGTVWVAEDGFLKPVKLTLGLTDNNVTEVEAVDSGTLTEDMSVVTGEKQASAESGSNPFSVKLFGNGKKKQE
jgi:HlyD family secretion protein